MLLPSSTSLVVGVARTRSSGVSSWSAPTWVCVVLALAPRIYQSGCLHQFESQSQAPTTAPTRSRKPYPGDGRKNPHWCCGVWVQSGLRSWSLRAQTDIWSRWKKCRLADSPKPTDEPHDEQRDAVLAVLYQPSLCCLVSPRPPPGWV